MEETEMTSSELKEFFLAVQRFLLYQEPKVRGEVYGDDSQEVEQGLNDDGQGYREALQSLGLAWDESMQLLIDGRLRFRYQNSIQSLLIDWDRLTQMGQQIHEARALASIGRWVEASNLVDRLMVTIDDRRLSGLWQMVHTWPVSHELELTRVHRRMYMSLNTLRCHPLSRFALQMA